MNCQYEGTLYESYKPNNFIICEILLPEPLNGLSFSGSNLALFGNLNSFTATIVIGFEI